MPHFSSVTWVTLLFVEIERWLNGQSSAVFQEKCDGEEKIDIPGVVKKIFAKNKKSVFFVIHHSSFI